VNKEGKLLNMKHSDSGGTLCWKHEDGTLMLGDLCYVTLLGDLC